MAPFGLIIVFIRVVSKKDTEHRLFVGCLITEERIEGDATEKDYVDSNARLSDALNGLTAELRATLRPKDQSDLPELIA